MPEETPHPDGQPVHPSVKSEPSDASFRWIFGLILAATAFGGLHAYITMVWFQGQNRYESEVRRSPFPLAPEPSEKLPPEPRLEQVDRLRGSERPDVYARQLTKEEVLDGYGPTGEKGYAHVPIERAMRYLAGKLPARAGGPDDPHAAGLVDGGEPNSGRLFRGKAKWSTR